MLGLVFTFGQLLNFGVHVGHTFKNTLMLSSWMIFSYRREVSIINLNKTIYMLRFSFEYIESSVVRQGPIWFVNLDSGMSGYVRHFATRAGEFHCSKWIMGMISNHAVLFSVIKMKSVGYGYGSKKQELLFDYKALYLTRYTWPRVLFCTSAVSSAKAIRELAFVNHPVIGIIDTNIFGQIFKIGIPGNDYSVQTIVFYNDLVSSFIIKNKFFFLLIWFFFIRKSKRLINFDEWLGSRILSNDVIDRYFAGCKDRYSLSFAFNMSRLITKDLSIRFFNYNSRYFYSEFTDIDKTVGDNEFDIFGNYNEFLLGKQVSDWFFMREYLLGFIIEQYYLKGYANHGFIGKLIKSWLYRPSMFLKILRAFSYFRYFRKFMTLGLFRRYLKRYDVSLNMKNFLFYFFLFTIRSSRLLCIKFGLKRNDKWITRKGRPFFFYYFFYLRFLLNYYYGNYIVSYNIFGDELLNSIKGKTVKFFLGFNLLKVQNRGLALWELLSIGIFLINYISRGFRSYGIKFLLRNYKLVSYMSRRLKYLITKNDKMHRIIFLRKKFFFERGFFRVGIWSLNSYLLLRRGVWFWNKNFFFFPNFLVRNKFWYFYRYMFVRKMSRGGGLTNICKYKGPTFFANRYCYFNMEGGVQSIFDVEAPFLRSNRFIILRCYLYRKLRRKKNVVTRLQLWWRFLCMFKNKYIFVVSKHYKSKLYFDDFDLGLLYDRRVLNYFKIKRRKYQYISKKKRSMIVLDRILSFLIKLSKKT